MSVKVAVRVRPFSQKQQSLNSKLCINMIDNTTRLYDDDNFEKYRDFTFDYCFWSHDQFIVDEAGCYRCIQSQVSLQSKKYADQQSVFQKIGMQMLSNIWEGYNCCLLTYGETGSGKTFSIMGQCKNKGIAPRLCEQMFYRIAKNDNPNKQYEVLVSMMEIYNEKVQDLLIPISKRPKEGHKIREHKTLGIYVEGMSKHYVDTYDLIEKKMEEGSRNRSIAATKMNASSSRAHTIISIEFKQTEIGQNNNKLETISLIHLVDSAGSEKVSKVGLKQAVYIGKSLSTLGSVICALVKKAQGEEKVFVPYRDSCITRILQNALGGNSTILMLCTISPSKDRYDETLSTLRYGQHLKKIKNKAMINQVGPQLQNQINQQIRQLRKHTSKLMQLYQRCQITPQQIQELNKAQKDLKLLNEYSTLSFQKKKMEIKHKGTENNNIDSKKLPMKFLNFKDEILQNVQLIDQQMRDSQKNIQ